MNETLRALPVSALRRPALALLAAVLAGCAQYAPIVPPPLSQGSPESGAAVTTPAAPAGAGSLRVTDLPKAPGVPSSNFADKRNAADAKVSTDVASRQGDEVGAINLQQVPLPNFVQIVYAEMLKRNVNIDPAVLARKDLVTFRAPASQTGAQLETALKLLLKSYQIAVVDVGGLVRVLPDNAQFGDLPEIRRSEALPDTPLPLRPVYQLVEMRAVRQNEVAMWLKTLFGSRVNIQEDAGRNALLLNGTPDNMQAALEAIRVLDQPLMSGRRSIALTPAYLSVDDLARRLVEVLSAQGYAVAPLGPQQGIRYPVTLLPVSAVNSVYVFAVSDEVLKHVEHWARTLDKPNERGVGKNFFTYQVRHKDAGDLAKTLDQLLSGNRARVSATPTATAAGSSSSSASRLTSVVVDQSSNMLIFQAEPDEYSQISSLLQMLDRPAKAALIEVTVAELSTIDKSQLGIEWLAMQGYSNGTNATFSTMGGTQIGSTGFNFRLFDTAGQVRAALNALASTNQATILSSPRVQARNGEQAVIQVGQEVPIITSQQTTTGTITTPTQTGVLQTVQYRSTGVILRVKPVIHSGDQVDIEVEQEVSAAAATNTGVNSSPTFSTRKLQTKMTLRNGATVMMGGLISNDSTQGNAGVPFLKDLPLIGNLFSTRTSDGNRRELVVLITPYILNDSTEAEAMTAAFRKQLGNWAGNAGPDRDGPPNKPLLDLIAKPPTGKASQ